MFVANRLSFIQVKEKVKAPLLTVCVSSAALLLCLRSHTLSKKFKTKNYIAYDMGVEK
jgi:hypothetical protein